jgi:hypothetical protein
MYGIDFSSHSIDATETNNLKTCLTLEMPAEK